MLVYSLVFKVLFFKSAYAKSYLRKRNTKAKIKIKNKITVIKQTKMTDSQTLTLPRAVGIRNTYI
jgi:hypothetical protein